MKIAASQLIDELVEDTRKMVGIAKKSFSPLSEEQILMKPDQYSWSIGECLEHLNLYADYYHPAILSGMEDGGSHSGDYVFKSGMVGDYFAKSMLPKKKMMKLSSPSNKNPAKVGVPDDVVNRFTSHQKEMLNLLGLARKRDLNNIKIPISIATWIKFKLGDTFRFVINHNQRHLVQAVRQLEAIRDRS